MALQEPHILVVGSGPVALFTALQLHTDGLFTTLITTTPTAPAPLCPELASLWGDEPLPALFHQSLTLWRNALTRLSLSGLLTEADFYDLATSPGRKAKYEEESMLEAVGGEPITFTPTLPPAFNSSTISGAKYWSAAPHIAPGLMLTLVDALTARSIPTHTIVPQSLSFNGGATLTLQDGTVLTGTHIVLTSAEAVRTLLATTPYALPLRPARGHKLTFTTPAEPLTPSFLHTV